MSPRRRAGGVRNCGKSFIMGLAIAIVLLIGFTMVFQSNIRVEVPTRPQVPLKLSEDIELERKYSPHHLHRQGIRSPAAPDQLIYTMNPPR